MYNFCKICLIGAVISASAATQGVWAQDTGVTDSTIMIGITAPLIGPAASFSAVIETDQAYIDMLSAEGGVCGKRIEAIACDDAYSPPKTKEQAKKLVEEDGVFLIFHVIGTGANAAIHEYMNANQEPQLLISSGASKWGHPDKYPWTVGFLPSYTAEGKICAKHILARYSRCGYAVTRGTFSIISQFWEEGDVYEQGSTRDTAQAADSATCKRDRPCCQDLSIFWDWPGQLLSLAQGLR